MTVTHAMPERTVAVRPRTRIPAFVDTSLRKIDRLSSGCKLDRASVAASDRESEHLRRQLSSLDSALRVSSEAFTIGGIAEGALGEMTAVLKDIRTAVLDAAGSAVRGQATPGRPEVDAAIARLDDIIRTTTFSGQTLLDGSRSLNYAESAAQGFPNDQPLLDRARTRIDHVHNPAKAVITVAFTPAATAAATDTRTTATADGTGTATEPATAATAAVATASSSTGGDPVVSDPARRAVIEADNAQTGTDLDGAVVTAAQEFVVTGAGGSRLFAFPPGTALGEITDSINAVADATGVAATLIFASDVRVDTAVPAHPDADGSSTAVLETVFPAPRETGAAPVPPSDPAAAATDTALPGEGREGETVPNVPDGENPGLAVRPSPDAESAAAPNTAAPDAAVPTGDADTAGDPSGAGTVPSVTVSRDLVHTLVPGLNCDPDGRLHIQAGAEAGAFTVYADHNLTRVVGEIRDGVFTATEGSALSGLGDDALAVTADATRIAEGDVFVLAFAGLALSNDSDVTLTGETAWFAPEESLVNGVRLQENTSRDGEIHLRYTPLTTRPDGSVASFRIDAYTDADCSDRSRVAASGPIVLPDQSRYPAAAVSAPSADPGTLPPPALDPTASSALPGHPQDVSTLSAAPVDPVAASAASVSSAAPTNPSTSSGPSDLAVASSRAAPTAAQSTASDLSDASVDTSAASRPSAVASGPADPASLVDPAVSISPVATGVTVRLSPETSPDGTDSGLYIALSVPAESLPPEPATATAAFTNLGLRLSSREYGSAAAVTVWNRAGHLFRHPDDSHAVVEPGAAVHVGGEDATVAINGQPVRTNGLTAAVVTSGVTGSFAFSEGEPGAAAIAVVGYDTGSVVAAAGRLTSEPPPPVRHEPAAATVRVGSPEPGATDGLRDADGNLVLVELDFTRLEPVPPSQAAPNGSAAPAEPPPVPLAAIPADRAAIPPADVLPSGPDSIQAGVPVPPTPSSSPSAAPVPAEPSPERHSAASSVERAAFPSVAERLSESDRNPAAASVPAESASQLDVAVRNDQSPASPRPAAPVYQGLAAVPDKGATVTVSAAVSPAPDSSRFAVPVPEAPADGTLTATSTDSPNPVLSPAPAPGNPNVAAKSAPAKSAAAVNAAAPGGDVASPASAAPAVSATETATLTGIPNPADDPVSSSPSAGHSGTVPEPASAATTDNAATAAAVVGSSADQSVLAGSSSSNPAEPVAFDPAKPLGPLRVASVTTPKSVSVEYVGEGTLRITCVTRDTNGKPVSKTVVTEKVQPENLRAGYYITHPGLRGLFIKTAGKVSLEESHDPAVSDPVDLTEQSLLPLEGGTNAATHPHAARRDELHSFAGGVPVAGEDDAVYAIQSLEMDKIGRVTFGGKDYSLADVKLGGAADLAGNSLLTLQILAEATDDIAALRDRLGAFKANMLEHNIRSLDVAIENIAVTEHAIHDSRTAEERVSFTRGMMLDQSGTSILAQANQKSQNVISLLQ